MKKIILLIFISTITEWSYSQIDTISSEIEFKKFVYQCIDSLIEKDSIRYSSIVGIRMELNLNGELKEYVITLKNKTRKLRKRDYKWLYNLLNQKNYKNIAILVYSPNELKMSKSMLLSIKYRGVSSR